MNILVTGGEGFIGKNLVNKLRGLGHKVVSVDIKGSPDYLIDICKDDLSIIKEDVDIVYHLAAQPFGKGSELNPFMDLDYNIRGTLKVCYFAQSRKVKKIVYTSTVAVYGNNELATEESLLNPLSNYGVSKLSGEFYIKKFNTPYIILRLWNTYGPGQDLSNEYKGVVAAFANQVSKGNYVKVTGSLERVRDIIHVDDVVSALIHSLNINESDIFNVSTKVPTTIKQLIETIIKAEDREVSDFVIENVGGHSGDQDGCVGDNTKLVNSGWNPTINLNDGIKSFLSYIKQSR